MPCRALLTVLAAIAMILLAQFGHAQATGSNAPDILQTLTVSGIGIGIAAPDAAKVMGAETCKDCHAAAFNAWQHSTHFATFKQQHRSQEAKDILKKLDFKSMKRNDLCLNCHYTSKVVDGKPKVISGVSCEACHGPGRDWTSDALHHEAASKATSPAGREDILQKCATAGMLRPRNIYLVAQNCYSCHTVPNEHLVNVGGHPAGSTFDLVAWSQGEVRHNFQNSDDQKNRVTAVERRRVMLVVGAMTDLEYSLRGVGLATAKGAYSRAMVSRFKRSMKLAKSILGLLELPALKATLPASGGKGLIKLNNGDALNAAADTISAAVKAFADEHDGSQLAAVDSLMPASSTYKGTAQP